MRFVLTLSLLFILFSSLPAQQMLSQDLKAMHDVLSKTYSYKDQINGDVKRTYYNMVDSLEHQHPQNDYEYFRLLAEMVEPLRDNHLFLYSPNRKSPVHSLEILHLCVPTAHRQLF